MSYRIAQDAKYVGNDYWRWWAWIDAPDDELDQVTEVVWILHPTFRRSRVRRANRSTKFRLETGGWGTFVLRAEVSTKSGTRQLVLHHLKLDYPSDTKQPETAAPRSAEVERPLTVFLSYSAQDSRAAARLRNRLQQSGVEVLDQTKIAAGDMVASGVRRMITGADVVLALVGDDDVGPWVRDELVAAVSLEKPAIALVGESGSPLGLPDRVKTVSMNFDHSEQVGRDWMAFLRDEAKA